LLFTGIFVTFRTNSAPCLAFDDDFLVIPKNSNAALGELERQQVKVKEVRDGKKPEKKQEVTEVTEEKIKDDKDESDKVCIFCEIRVKNL
jgi:hypothetical protein